MSPRSWPPDETALDDDTPCPYCGTVDCARACTAWALAAQTAAFPRVQAYAETLYAAYVHGHGPLGSTLPPWQDLIERQQYAWRCVARVALAQEEDDA
jgi:hypothetical protein